MRNGTLRFCGGLHSGFAQVFFRIAYRQRSAGRVASALQGSATLVSRLAIAACATRTQALIRANFRPLSRNTEMESSSICLAELPDKLNSPRNPNAIAWAIAASGCEVQKSILSNATRSRSTFVRHDASRQDDFAMACWMVPQDGLEPPTHCLRSNCSTS